MSSSWGAAWRVARGLALSGSRRQRWRQVSLVVSSVVSTVALLVGVMMVWQVVLADAHLDARQPVVGSRATATWGKTMPILPGGVGQIPVQWIEPDPGHEGDPALVPPGLDRLPGPGEAVVSPGLVRQGLSAEDLGLRSSTAGSGQGGVIGDDFLISRSEGYAIARPPQGQKLDRDMAERISGYGPGESRVSWTETTLDVPAGTPGLMSVLALVVFPAVLLLGTAARAVSGVTRERARHLWALGVSRAAIRQVVVLETAVLCGIGAAAGGLLWGLTLSHRTSWPGNDALLLPAARIPLWCAAPVALGVVLLGSVWAATASTSERRAGARFSLGDWGLLPLVLGLLALAVAIPLPVWLGSADSDFSLLMLMGGAVLVIVGLPLGLPVLSRWVARLFARSSHPTRWLAAKRLGGGATRLARAGAFVGVLVFIVGSEVSLYNGTQSGPAFAQAAGEAKVWSAYWDDAPTRFSDALAQRAEAEGGEVAPSRVGADGSRHGTAVVFPDCDAARGFFGMDVPVKQCGGASTEGAAAVRLFTDVAIGDPARWKPSDTVYVSGPLDWDGADALRLFEGTTRPAVMQVLGPDDDFQHPGTDWMRTGVLAASALLLVGLLRTLGDRALESAQEHRLLERTGLNPGEAARTTMVATLLPVVIAVPIALVAAWLFAYVGGTADYTQQNYMEVTLVALLTAGLCVGVMVGTLLWQRRRAD